MTEDVLGIDLGTSSVKLCVSDAAIREPYTENTADGWWDAVCRATKRLNGLPLRGIAVSAQVGTYMTDHGTQIPWNASGAEDELEEVLAAFPPKLSMREIGMVHPPLRSYPVVRILYLLRREKNIQRIEMPKEMLLRRLTGRFVSDPFSWRGLASQTTCRYSDHMLRWLNISADILPPLRFPTDLAGRITEEAAQQTGLRPGTPVFVGCNDFYAGLLGMGVIKTGTLFDLTGTSEHLGIITNRDSVPENLINSPYFAHRVLYGVTATSGKALDFGRILFPYTVDLSQIDGRLPLFLPYLCGERAPVWDSMARGAFVGLTDSTDAKLLRLSVLEGITMNLYQIYQQMGPESPECLLVSGGAAQEPLLNRLKASMFDVPVRIFNTSEASAVGARIIARTATGDYPTLFDAAKAEAAEISEEYPPDHALTQVLKQRFAIWRTLYPALRPAFHTLADSDCVFKERSIPCPV